MRSGGITAIGQEGFQIRAIEFAGLCDRHAVERDDTLTEQRIKDIIGYCREVCSNQILPFPRDQLASDVGFHIKVNVSIVLGGYQKFQIALIDGAVGL